MGDQKDRDQPDDETPSPPDRDEQDRRTEPPNPPRTTKHGITAPKFGSAGSGGAEIEPGLKRN
ncbi:MAG TPA: hypothetical protein VGM50_17560 [Gemmatimonadaceae bacterium]|jgi:hypothetical protein